jgi:hypothetical protein
MTGETKIELTDLNYPKGMIFNIDSLPEDYLLGLRGTGTINENGKINIKDVLSYDIINKHKNKYQKPS